MKVDAIKRYTSHSILASLLGLGATTALAQTDQTAEFLEEIVVMGRYQRALQTALGEQWRRMSGQS